MMSTRSKNSLREIIRKMIMATGSSIQVPFARPLHLAAVPVDFAYCAGFFDGEGCIHLARQVYKDPKRRATYRMRVDVFQNDLGVLQHFVAVVGVPGRLYNVKRTLSQNKPCFRVCYDGKAAFEVLRILRPYLIRKAPEADVAMLYAATCEISNHPGPNGCSAAVWALRKSFYLKLRAMK
jgi:hypothetical protein